MRNRPTKIESSPRRTKMKNLLSGSIVIMIVIAYLSNFSWFITTIRVIFIGIGLIAGSYLAFKIYQWKRNR